MMINSQIFELNKNWKFQLKNLNNAKESEINFDYKKSFPATVPGTVHTDLLNNNFIEDPFFADNELRYQWIAKCDWDYSTEFDKPGNFKDGNEYIISFEGLDTIADVYLNDEKIISSDNMFRQCSADVTNKLLPVMNKLSVVFQSPIKYSKEQEQKYGMLPVALNSSRVYIRKAQYSFGWDWGPTFPTSGIWKRVTLQNKNANPIKNISFTTLEINDSEAKVQVEFEIETLGNSKFINVGLSENDIIVQNKIPISIADNKFKTELKIGSPKLWYPNGMGEAFLYNLFFEILDSSEQTIFKKSNKVGIRKIDLQLKNNGDNDYKFIINNKSVYIKGVNWIPADSFLPRTTSQKYERLLELAVNANINMVRVWGGGIYESDEFYNFCDEKGLLVWQDFMFACGAYPEHEKMIENIKEEVSQNIFRLQHHPSVAIWCGNNENEWGWFQDQKLPVNELPGYKIYNSIIPNILKSIDPTSNYWQSSPFGGDKDPNSSNGGNTHQWDIWSFWKDYTEVKSDDSLFVTEFGFQGPANIDTFNKYIPEEFRKVQNPIFEHHNKQVEGPERIFKFLSAHLPVNTNWEDFIYLTQLNQGFALKTCLEHWRTNNRTNGSIIWQLNDVWPVTSWSLIDSEELPKISYHFVKNAFEKQLLVFKKNLLSLHLILQNHDNEKFNGKIKLGMYSFESGHLMDEKQIDTAVGPNSTEIIFNDCLLEFQFDTKSILVASLYDPQLNLVSRNYFVKDKWKYLNLPDANVVIKGENSLLVETDKIALFVDLYYPGIEFNKRGFVLLPDETIKLNYKSKADLNFNLESIKIFTLNNYLK